MNATRDPKESSEHTVLFVGSAPVAADEIAGAFGGDSTAVTILDDSRRAFQWLTAASNPGNEQQPPDTVFLTSEFESPTWTTLLDALKSSPQLGAVPVVVLTDEEADAETAYAHGGNAHITVPQSPDAYTDCLDLLAEFWLEWTEYPSEYLCGNNV